MTSPNRNPGGVRAAALAHLGVRDERAREILAHAHIAVEDDDARWEASHGDFGGVRVVLGTDARSLGAISALPAIHDALCDALAAAVSAPGVSMTAFVPRWTSSASHPYRGSGAPSALAPGDAELAAALVAFFEGSLDPELADAARTASVTIRGDEVVIGSPRRAALERAVAVLRGR